MDANLFGLNAAIGMVGKIELTIGQLSNDSVKQFQNTIILDRDCTVTIGSASQLTEYDIEIPKKYRDMQDVELAIVYSKMLDSFIIKNLSEKANINVDSNPLGYNEITECNGKVVTYEDGNMTIKATTTFPNLLAANSDSSSNSKEIDIIRNYVGEPIIEDISGGSDRNIQVDSDNLDSLD